MKHKNPVPTVDIIIECEGGIVLIERKKPPDPFLRMGSPAGPCPADSWTMAKPSKRPP